MCSYLNFIRTKWRQQGAILAFSALLMPLIIVGAGLAVDIGNVYVQYARLQNAADAAALAGAREFAVKKELPQKGRHNNADEVAKKYIKGEYHNLGKNEDNVQYNDKTFTTGKSDTAVYYRVKLEKEVPLHFWGKLYKNVSIEKKDTFTVSTTGIAAIPIEKKKSWFNNNMIIFRTKFIDENAVDNNDTFSNGNFVNNNVIRDTYDGRVAYTNGKGDNMPFKPDEIKPNYHIKEDEIKSKFFTSKAKSDYENEHNPKKLIADDAEAKFSSNNTIQSGDWFCAEYNVYNFDNFINHMNRETERAELISDQNKQNYIADENTFKSIDRLRVSRTMPNFNFTVKKSLGKESDEPILIYVEEGSFDFKLNLDANNDRPLIICLGGNDNLRRQVEINLNGHTFRGVIYAPYCDTNRGVFIKTNGQDSSIIGTVVGESIDIQNYGLHFSYCDYLGSSSGNGSFSSNTDGIALVSPSEKITWE